MKKIFLLTAAFCAAMSINAKVIEIDLTKAASAAYTGCSSSSSVNDGVLDVSYSAGGWEWAGVEFPLSSLTNVTGISYDYVGDGTPGFNDGIVLYVYLRDVEGNRWIQSDYWPNLQNTEWQKESIAPNAALDWDAPTYSYGEKAFTRLGFIANPGSTYSGTFKLQNIKITTQEGGEEPPVTDNPDSLMYKGEILPHNTEFTRTMSGQIGKNIGIPEVSGIACSRVTPGYIWMQSDETDANTNPFIVATDETGSVLGAKVSFDHVYRWDWEDMCGGVYNGKNYLFIGGFGDNNHTDGEYCIIYFEEPAIDPQNPNVSVAAKRIKFEYPDHQKHNCESMMYDNIEQMLYIVTKVYDDVNQVYSLPFRLDYGDVQQTLTYVCDLGVTSDIGEGDYQGKIHRYKGFHLATAADISPDGKYILIKNHNNYVAIYSWVLLWEREGTESISETLKNRQPKVIDCYEYEWQGEAIAWKDNNTFYTTSDSDIDSEPPIYKYTREGYEGFETIRSAATGTQKMIKDGQLIILKNGIRYNILGTEVK